jgi:uncharacterized protein with PIN domain
LTAVSRDRLSGRNWDANMRKKNDIKKEATFRFYEELNDFLPQTRRKASFSYRFSGSPSIKDAIEAVGVPHTEVDLILVNGISVDFSHRIEHGDFISVYPVFERLDISVVTRLRPAPLRNPRFVLDVHLGTLAKKLRMLGFDTRYETGYTDGEIARIASDERRIVLTRDIGLLKRSEVERGYWLRSQTPAKQFLEVLEQFDLFSKSSPFSRCLNCNGIIRRVGKHEVEKLLQPKTRRYYDEFYRCDSCGKIFWKGSHYLRMMREIEAILPGK